MTKICECGHDHLHGKTFIETCGGGCPCKKFKEKYVPYGLVREGWKPKKPTEFKLNEELEKWYKKWMRKRVTGRCLIELKERDKTFLKKLKEETTITKWMESGKNIEDYCRETINNLAGEELSK